MKRTKLNVVVIGVCMVLVASAVAVAAGTGQTDSRPYSAEPGTPVPAAELSVLARGILAYAGGVRAVSILGTRGDHVFYRIATASGDACYAMGKAGVPRQLGVVGCLDGDNITTPLIDMSTVVVDPSNGSVVRLARVEGVAADQVVRVAIEANGTIGAETEVRSNVYRFEETAIPEGADAILALDAGGAILWRKPITAS